MRGKLKIRILLGTFAGIALITVTVLLIKYKPKKEEIIFASPYGQVLTEEGNSPQVMIPSL